MENWGKRKNEEWPRQQDDPITLGQRQWQYYQLLPREEARKGRRIRGGMGCLRPEDSESESAPRQVATAGKFHAPLRDRQRLSVAG